MQLWIAEDFTTIVETEAEAQARSQAFLREIAEVAARHRFTVIGGETRLTPPAPPPAGAEGD